MARSHNKRNTVKTLFLSSLFLFNLLQISGNQSIEKIVALVANGHSKPIDYSDEKILESDGDEQETTSYYQNKQISGNGLAWQYLLGSNLKKLYPDFIDKKNLQSTKSIKIQMGNADLYSQSAQAFLLGLFGGDFDSMTQKFDQNYSVPEFDQVSPDNSEIANILPNQYYPFATTVPRNWERIFEPYFLKSSCQRIKIFKSINNKDITDLKNKENMKLINDNPKVNEYYQQIRSKNGDAKDDEDKNNDILELIDLLEAKKYSSLPEEFETIIKADDYTSLKNFGDYLDFLVNYRNKALDIQNSEIGNLIKIEIDNYRDKSDNNQDDKLALFFGTNYNIWSILIKLKLASKDCLSSRVKKPKKTVECEGRPLPGSSLVFIFRNINSNDKKIGKKDCIFY